jgi:hypothetical protein
MVSRAGHGDVVDGAVHREAADVAAGKEERRHHIASVVITMRPRARQAPPGRFPARGSRCRTRREQLLDELGHRAPARAVERSTWPLAMSSFVGIFGCASRAPSGPPRRGTGRRPVGRAGAFGRHHARSHRTLGRADRAEDACSPGPLEAAQDLAAGAGLVVGDRRIGHVGEAHAPRRIARTVAQAQRAVGSRAEPAPLEALARLEDLRDQRLGLQVALRVTARRVLVLDLGAALVELARPASGSTRKRSMGSKPAMTTIDFFASRATCS